MINLLARILKILNSETAPWQISLAVCLAMIAGFTPFFCLHNLLVLLLVLVLRVNLTTFIVSWLVLSGVAYLLDPVFHSLGLTVLNTPALAPLWTALYNNVFFVLDKFNNTVVMGSFLTALILFIPVFAAANWIIRRYRRHILEWARKTRVAQILKGSRLFQMYQALSG